MNIPNLWEYIEASEGRFKAKLKATGFSFPTNSYVSWPDFESLYVRFTKRFIQDTDSHTGKWFSPVLDIANVAVEEGKRGQGIFTKLISDIRQKYPHIHIYVESAHHRFGDHLIKIGLRPTGVREEWHVSRSYFLEAKSETRPAMVE